MRLLKYGMLTFLLIISTYTVAADSFVIDDIEVEGLQRIEYQTLLNYLPVSIGDNFEYQKSRDILKRLYDTHFFSDIKLAKKGNHLLISVKERPTIGQITVSGNKAIPTDKLLEVLKLAGLSDGDVYDEAVLSAIEKSLVAEYNARGQYNSDVSTSVIPLDRNRVSIAISIFEGKVAKIRQINILGNQLFTDKELRKVFNSKERGIWASITSKDRYASEKLEGDLESLRSYYLDRGYLDFDVTATQVSITPDKQDVYITVTVTEGEPYTISDITLSGDLVATDQELRQLLQMQPGDTFSRQALINSSEAIIEYLGDRGYFYAQVQPIPQIDEDDKQVALNLVVQPSNLVYVRRIYFTGNKKTSEVALRHELLQQEGGLYSTSDVQESTRQLNNTSYLRNAQVRTHPAADADDQVDIEYEIDEDQAAMAIFQIGYSTTDKLLFSIGFKQFNFLGSGREFGINASTSAFRDQLDVSYVNPNYTIDGVTRGIDAYLGRTHPGRTNITNFTTDEYGASVFYSIPRSNYSGIQLSYGYENLKLKVGGGASNQIKEFTRKFGNHFGMVVLKGGWYRSTYDRSIMTTQGTRQTLGVEVGIPATNNKVHYYKATYNITHYLPVYKDDFILVSQGTIGYGDGYASNSKLPFFKNYYAGGMGSVRGFAGNSLGPKDSKGDALGGDTLLTGSLALIFPNMYPNNLRTSAFLDAGNTFNRHDDGISLGQIRYSLGLAATWFSPIGPLEFSLAKPINAKKGDRENIFEFTIGYSI